MGSIPAIVGGTCFCESILETGSLSTFESKQKPTGVAMSSKHNYPTQKKATHCRPPLSAHSSLMLGPMSETHVFPYFLTNYHSRFPLMQVMCGKSRRLEGEPRAGR